jgi:hypothetical protein
MGGKEKSSDGASPKDKSVLPALPLKPSPLLLEVLQAELLETAKHETSRCQKTPKSHPTRLISTHGAHPSGKKSPCTQGSSSLKEQTKPPSPDLPKRRNSTL